MYTVEIVIDNIIGSNNHGGTITNECPDIENLKAYLGFLSQYYDKSYDYELGKYSHTLIYQTMYTSMLIRIPKDSLTEQELRSIFRIN